MLQIIWNSSTRAELLKFVDQQRASQNSDGSYDLQDSLVFTYKALSKELYVGNVYLRVYNDQPDFEISEPETFCIALVDFISHLVNNPMAADSDMQEKPDSGASSSETSEQPNDTGDGLDSEEKTDGSSSTSVGQVAEKEEFGLVKNLKFALISLQVCFVLWLWYLYGIIAMFSVNLCLSFSRVESTHKQPEFGINIFHQR